jgi:protein CpxP
MKLIAATLASAFLLAGAFAQSADRTVAAIPVDMKSDAQRSLDVEKHIKDMHAKLKITSAEEAQWAAVAQAMRDSAMELETAIDQRQALVSSATAIDNLDAYGDIAQAHVDGVKRLAAVFSTLYESMSEEQKKLADDVFAQRAHKGTK